MTPGGKLRMELVVLEIKGYLLTNEQDQTEYVTYLINMLLCCNILMYQLRLTYQLWQGLGWNFNLLGSKLWEDINFQLKCSYFLYLKADHTVDFPEFPQISQDLYCLMNLCGSYGWFQKGQTWPSDVWKVKRLNNHIWDPFTGPVHFFNFGDHFQQS